MVSRIPDLTEVLLTRRSRVAARWVGAAATALLATACGGSNSPAPTPTPPPSGGATITITSSGVSPRDLTVPVGSRVTFLNNDGTAHDMASDPHPAHTDCPEINVGFVQAGQSRATNNLNSARTCAYHDHNQPTNNSLRGTIRIQ